MAPIVESNLSAVPAYVLAVAGFLVAVLMTLMCADGDKKKPKTKKMQKVPECQFTDLKAGNNNGAGGSAPGTPVNTGKLHLHQEIPLPTSTNDQPKGKKAVEKLGIDAIGILRKTFKDDKSLNQLSIDERRLNLSDIIGSGNFGLVYKGTLLDKNMSNPREVAVKTVHGMDCSKEDLEMFIKESSRMRGFAHQYVMCIDGIVTRENKPFIVLPYMHNGDLRSYVAQKTRKFTLEDLTRFGYQVAQGMAYLSSKNFIHRDLAARNCMVDHNGNVKVADFGLSRDLYAADYYKMTNLQTPLPIRWVALESILSTKFTTKSDVWSFGVLMWELITRGKNPYPDIKDNVQVLKFIRDGGRMECPSYVTSSVKDVITKCWLQNPSDRPAFQSIVTMLHKVLNDDDDYLKPTKTRR